MLDPFCKQLSQTPSQPCPIDNGNQIQSQNQHDQDKGGAVLEMSSCFNVRAGRGQYINMIGKGHDLIEVYEQIAAAKDLAEKYGLELSIFNGGKNEQKIIAEIDND